MLDIMIELVYHHLMVKQDRPITRRGNAEAFMLNNSILTVTRSIEVLKVRGDKSQLSRVFFIRKTDGTETMKRDVRWVLTSLVKPCEVGIDSQMVMSRDECPLYWIGPQAGSFAN